MKDWIKELMDEYPTGRSDAAIDRLARIFGEYDDSLMQRAVDAYMLKSEYFPKVGDLFPHVQHAQYQVKQQDIMKPGIEAKNKWGTRFWLSLGIGDKDDAEILAWEQQRGTMPPDDQLESEWLEAEAV
jgi:hypothetical protein